MARTAWEKEKKRISNCCVSSESCNAIQSTRAFATKIGCTSGDLTFHFCVKNVISLDAGPFSTSEALTSPGPCGQGAAAARFDCVY